MKLITTRCAICNSIEDCTIIYNRKFDDSDINEEVFSARRLADYTHCQIVKCNNDGLVRSNNIPDPAIFYELYKKAKFTYKEEIENLKITYLDTLAPVLQKLPKDAHILEIGCGNGFMLQTLYDKGYRNIYGGEPCVDAVRAADAKIKDRIMVDILRPGVFQPQMFDLIFFFQTLEHIQDPNPFLDICYNILKREGVISAVSHNVEGLQAKIFGELSPIISIDHAYLYSDETIRKIFEKHRFIPFKIYSPSSAISLKHLLRLIPLPKKIKMAFLNSKNKFLNVLLQRSIKLRLGNVCIIAKKTE